MKILDVFKKRKKIEEKKELEKPKAEVEEKPKVKKPTKKKEKVEPVIPKTPAKIPGIAWRVLKAPHITEKATYLAGKNQYVFRVKDRANKTEIEKAIENLYGVEVVSVKIIKIPKKHRRLGRISGWRKGYKKAIVKIKEGQKIEVMPR